MISVDVFGAAADFREAMTIRTARSVEMMFRLTECIEFAKDWW